MRKLIYSINLTADGCCDHTKGIGDEAIHEFFQNLILECDTFVYGRKTYELMVPFWPDIAKSKSGSTKSINDFAEAYTSVKQIVVFSRTLEKADYEKAIVVQGDLHEEILELKQQEGKSILLGGVDLAAQVVETGLVDEYYFVIHPVLVGEGRRLFDTVQLQHNLRLIETKVIGINSVMLRYASK